MVTRVTIKVTNGVTLTGCKMAKVKDPDIKKLSTTKQEFVSALRKVSQRIEKPKTPSKR